MAHLRTLPPLRRPPARNRGVSRGLLGPRRRRRPAHPRRARWHNPAPTKCGRSALLRQAVRHPHACLCPASDPVCWPSGFTRQSFPWSGHQSLRPVRTGLRVRLAAGVWVCVRGPTPLLAESDASVLACGPRIRNVDERPPIPAQDPPRAVALLASSAPALAGSGVTEQTVTIDKLTHVENGVVISTRLPDQLGLQRRQLLPGLTREARSPQLGWSRAGASARNSTFPPASTPSRSTPLSSSSAPSPPSDHHRLLGAHLRRSAHRLARVCRVPSPAVPQFGGLDDVVLVPASPPATQAPPTPPPPASPPASIPAAAREPVVPQQHQRPGNCFTVVIPHRPAQQQRRAPPAARSTSARTPSSRPEALKLRRAELPSLDWLLAINFAARASAPPAQLTLQRSQHLLPDPLIGATWTSQAARDRRRLPHFQRHLHPHDPGTLPSAPGTKACASRRTPSPACSPPAPAASEPPAHRSMRPGCIVLGGRGSPASPAPRATPAPPALLHAQRHLRPRRDLARLHPGRRFVPRHRHQLLFAPTAHRCLHHQRRLRAVSQSTCNLAGTHLAGTTCSPAPARSALCCAGSTCSITTVASRAAPTRASAPRATAGPATPSPAARPTSTR